MKILVVGDSHTDIDPQKTHGSPNPKDKIFSYSWLYHAADEYPDVEFISYALFGSSHLYYDLVLKHCADQNFDACIVQLTGWDRFMIPITDVQRVEHWQPIKVKENLIHYKFLSNYIKTFTNNISTGDALNTEEKAKFELVQHNLLNSNIPQFFTKLFLKSLDQIYSLVYKNLFYFSWEIIHKANNINVENSVLTHMINKFSDKQLVKDWMTEDLHLNYDGSKIVYENYIKPFVLSKIL